MAASACRSHGSVLSVLLAMAALVPAARAQLSPTFYASSCPAALLTIRTAVRAAVALDARTGASLLRLHFHDCFVQARLRRVRSSRRHGQFPRGEGCGPERGVAARVRRRRRHQAAAGGALPADRVVRRHPRRRRPRLCRCARGAVVDGAARQEGRHDGELLHREHRSPLAGVKSKQPARCICQERLEQHRHGCSVRSPHGGAGAVPELPGQDLQRDQHRRGLRGDAEGRLLGDRRRRRARAAGRVHAERVRQRLLRRSGRAAGTAALRSAAVQRRLDGWHGQEVRGQPGTVPKRLRGGHGEDGWHWCLDREQWAGPAQLPEGELASLSF